MDVVLQARIGAGEPKWFWVYEYGGNRRASREEEIQSGDAELSTQYVIESLADRYQKASANRRYPMIGFGGWFACSCPLISGMRVISRKEDHLHFVCLKVFKLLSS